MTPGDAALEELREEFCMEAHQRLDTLQELLLQLDAGENAGSGSLFGDIKRELHTLKGNAGMMGFASIQNESHRLEDALDAPTPDLLDLLLEGIDRIRDLVERVHRTSSAADVHHIPVASAHDDSRIPRLPGFRVSPVALEQMLESASELLIIENAIDDAIRRVRDHGSEAWADLELAQDALRRSLADLRDRVFKMRLTPLQPLFLQLRRIARDEAARDEKVVQFTAGGGETQIDKALLEVCSEALGHLVRNAIVHGIEGQDRRIASGKPPSGSVRVTAATTAHDVEIVVQDDGAGIDTAAVSRAAAELGLNVAGDNMVDLIFSAGLSTRTEASMSAGRGIGLSASLEAVRRFGGSLLVTTEAGIGTRFILRIPLQVSIVRVLLVTCGSPAETYAIPVSAIAFSRRVDVRDLRTLNGSPGLQLRDRLVPAIDLGRAFQPTSLPRPEYVVVLRAAGSERALFVHGFAGVFDAVIKPLDPLFTDAVTFRGSTVLNDGRVVLVLDPSEIVGLPLLADDSSAA